MRLRPCPPPGKVFFFLMVFYISKVPFHSHHQAWLTEIHEYAQEDVVLMLLGNKARHCGKCFSGLMNSGRNNIDRSSHTWCTMVKWKDQTEYLIININLCSAVWTLGDALHRKTIHKHTHTHTKWQQAASFWKIYNLSVSFQELQHTCCNISSGKFANISITLFFLFFTFLYASTASDSRPSETENRCLRLEALASSIAPTLHTGPELAPSEPIWLISSHQTRTPGRGLCVNCGQIAHTHLHGGIDNCSCRCVFIFIYLRFVCLFVSAFLPRPMPLMAGWWRGKTVRGLLRWIN